MGIHPGKVVLPLLLTLILTTPAHCFSPVDPPGKLSASKAEKMVIEQLRKDPTMQLVGIIHKDTDLIHIGNRRAWQVEITGNFMTYIPEAQPWDRNGREPVKAKMIIVVDMDGEIVGIEIKYKKYEMVRRILAEPKGPLWNQIHVITATPRKSWEQ
ncbi:MAG: hypothetical protein DRO11_00295 [Methanobacteriota archaeon]|nr:MAG: hypothetical protein DRO11_00295 [Euryarchaeota archaeon]